MPNGDKPRTISTGPKAILQNGLPSFVSKRRHCQTRRMLSYVRLWRFKNKWPCVQLLVNPASPLGVQQQVKNQLSQSALSQVKKASQLDHTVIALSLLYFMVDAFTSCQNNQAVTSFVSDAYLSYTNGQYLLQVKVIN